MRRLVIGSLVIALMTVVPTMASFPAWARSVDQVTITGPWLVHPIKVVPVDEKSSAQLDLLRQGSGIEIAMLRELPDQFTDTRPPGDLGPRYRMTWNAPGSGTVTQDVYPYAAPSPLVHTSPQQLVVRHGWFTAPVMFGDTLRSLGLPDPARPTTPATPPSASGAQPRQPRVPPVAIAVAIALLLAAAGWALRGPRRAARYEQSHPEEHSPRR